MSGDPPQPPAEIARLVAKGQFTRKLGDKLLELLEGQPTSRLNADVLDRVDAIVALSVTVTSPTTASATANSVPNGRRPDREV